MSKEPKQLRRGKAFEQEVQADWAATAQGFVNIECTIPILRSKDSLKRQRRGRMDIYVNEIGDDQVSIVEIKATNWDRIIPRNITKNLGAHRRQIYKYIEKFLDGEGMTVYPSLLYPTAPVTPGLKERIEEYLNNYGISVVWYRD